VFSLDRRLDFGEFRVCQDQRNSSASADNARLSRRVFAFLGYRSPKKLQDMRGANQSAHPAMLPMFS
jgi:hypothetical protein